jgi:glycosyltransferase involved in cell wall biosynthesis
MSKLNLLFVVKDFYQAGAQRFMYEVDSVIDRSKYNITILCLHNKSKIDSKWHPYYLDKHKALGSKILFIDPFLITNSSFKRIKSKANKIFFDKKYYDNIDDKSLNKFLEDFDVINWIGEYSFYHQLSERNLKRSLIHIMSAKFQDPYLYKKYDFEYPYNFVSGFNENECQIEFSEFKNINHFYFPLIMKMPFEHKPWKYINSKEKKIGIFTRLNKYKPLDPFFYSFQLLLDKLPNCELHVFGNGDPENEGMTRYLKNLGITNRVYFRGHQSDIVETVLKEEIDLSWFQGHNNTKPAGYAGFDICTTGTPLVCWDFIEQPVDPFNEVYPHYKNLNQFVAKSYEILISEQSAERLSNLQFIDISEKRDSYKYIHYLDSIFEQIVK